MMNKHSVEQPEELAVLLAGDRTLRTLIQQKRLRIENNEALTLNQRAAEAIQRLLPALDQTGNQWEMLFDAVVAAPEITEARRVHKAAFQPLIELEYVRLECQRMIAAIVQDMLLAELKVLHPTLHPNVITEIQLIQAENRQTPVLKVEISFLEHCDACTMQSVGLYVQNFLSQQLENALEMGEPSTSMWVGHSVMVFRRLY